MNPAENLNSLHVEYLQSQIREDRDERAKISDRLRVVEIGVSSIKTEVKIWGGILGAMITAVLVAILTKR